MINVYWELLAALGFTSFALYIFMIATIIRFRQHTELRSSFFGLWLSLAVADSLHFIHSYVLLRFPRLGLFYDFFNAHRTGLLPKCSILFSYYLFGVQLLGNLLFALNRYTALSKMAQHEQVRIDNTLVLVSFNYSNLKLHRVKCILAKYSRCTAQTCWHEGVWGEVPPKRSRKKLALDRIDLRRKKRGNNFVNKHWIKWTFLEKRTLQSKKY